MKGLKIIIIAALFFVLGAGAGVYAEEEKDKALAQQLVGIWAPPPSYATYQGRSVKMVGVYRMKIEANGTKVNTTCLGTPHTTYDLSETWYRPTNLPYINADLRDGRLVGRKNLSMYGAEGASIYGVEPYDAGIEMSPDGNSFTEIFRDGKKQQWLKE